MEKDEEDSNHFLDVCVMAVACRDIWGHQFSYCPQFLKTKETNGFPRPVAPAICGDLPATGTTRPDKQDIGPTTATWKYNAA